MARDLLKREGVSTRADVIRVDGARSRFGRGRCGILVLRKGSQ